MTTAITTEELFTEKWHYTIIDAPGYHCFTKTINTGASQADVAFIIVSANGHSLLPFPDATRRQEGFEDGLGNTSN